MLGISGYTGLARQPVARLGAVSGAALPAQHNPPSWKSHILADLLRTKENKQTKDPPPVSRSELLGLSLGNPAAMETGSRDLERDAGTGT